MVNNLSNAEKKHSKLCREVCVIGLIGDVAGGKSTVARRLAALGAGWLDADRIAHRCLTLPSVRRQVSEHFGPMVLNSAGHVDRRVLAQMVFGANAGSDQRLQYLEHILHPLTRQLAIRRMDRWALRGKTAIVLDAPLLLEAHWDLLCDEVWCVRAPFPRRLRWANLRGWSREELVAREAKQVNIREKELRSTVLIDNESERVDFLRQIDRLFAGRIQNLSTDIDLP